MSQQRCGKDRDFIGTKTTIAGTCAGMKVLHGDCFGQVCSSKMNTQAVNKGILAVQYPTQYFLHFTASLNFVTNMAKLNVRLSVNGDSQFNDFNSSDPKNNSKSSMPLLARLIIKDEL